MPEPMTPVPNPVHRRSTSERRTDRLRLVENAQARAKPMLVVDSPVDIPRFIEHPAVLNGRFGLSPTLTVEAGSSVSRFRWQAIAKRLIDIVVAAIGIAVCAPLMAVLAAL